jgi:hypothetical protein
LARDLDLKQIEVNYSQSKNDGINITPVGANRLAFFFGAAKKVATVPPACHCAKPTK